MPVVRIEMLKGRSTLERKAVMENVRKTLVEALKLPDSAVTQRLYVLERECFDIPPGRSEKYMVIEVTMFPGRSKAAKKKMYELIVRNLEKDAGIPPEDVFIIVKEPPLDNWGVRGGKQASEVDIGYDLKI